MVSHQLLKMLKMLDINKDVDEIDEDPFEMNKVETHIKSIIDIGFSSNVQEELLYFDKDGNLESVQNAPEFELSDEEDAGEDYMGSEDYYN